MAAAPGWLGAPVCEGARAEEAAGPGAAGALGRWTVENCGGEGGGAALGAAPSFPAATGGVGGGEARGGAGS
jgi:hypothetical protein